MKRERELFSLILFDVKIIIDMNKKLTLLGLIGAITGASFMLSCTSDDVVDANNEVESLVSTDFITRSNEQKVEFNIDYEVPKGYKVVFDVYAENPYDITADGFSKKSDIKPILTGITDENGCYQVSRVISGGVKEIFVVSDVVGVPALLYGEIQENSVAPVELDITSLIEKEQISSRSTWDALFLGGWNNWGRPDYIDGSIKCPVAKKDLRAISAALPEWKSVNAKYTDENYIYIKEEAEVWISLLSEKSLFNNVLGYYCYTEGMSKDDIDEIVALPRANIALLNRSGLKYGEYVKLKYLNPVTKELEEKFPAGVRIGWVLNRSGYHCLTGQVGQGVYQFYSDESWNPEKNSKDHVAVFKTSEGNVIVGIEDLHNETCFSDNDCNDIIFHVASYPESAILVNTVIPDVPDNDYVEEEVDVVQPLSLIVDVAENDELANDLYVASSSKLQMMDAYVVGVQDVLYIANSATMAQLTETTYTEDEKTRKIVVRTTIKFARAAETGEEKKGRTVVRTTIKNTDYSDDMARSAFGGYGSVDALIAAMIEKHREGLADGEVLKLEIVMEFEGVEYDLFVNSIDVPPYSPFIKDVKE